MPEASDSIPAPNVSVQIEQNLQSNMNELDTAKQSLKVISNETERKLSLIDQNSLQREMEAMSNENEFLKQQVKARNQELETLQKLKMPKATRDRLVMQRVINEKEEQIKYLREKIVHNEKELHRNRALLSKITEELEEKTKHLIEKSAEVRQLKENVEKLKDTFNENHEEMNQKLRQATVASISLGKSLELTKVICLQYNVCL